MPDIEVSFTAHDIRQFDLSQITSEAESKTWFAYGNVFITKARQFEERGDRKSQVICELIAIFCSFGLDIDSPNEPYRPKWVSPDGRHSLVPSDVDEPYLAILVEVVGELSDSELRSRIADVLWVLRKGTYELAQIAIDAYLESASVHEAPTEWYEGAVRIERALQLSAQLGRDGEYFTKTISYIENLLGRLNGEDPLWFSHKLMSLLLEHKQGDASKYCGIAEKLAQAAESSHYWRRARDYWEVNAQWHARIGDDESAQASKLRSTETFIKEANDLTSLPTPNYRAAALELKSAVEALRRIGAPKAYIQQTHARLLECQEKDTDFQTTSFTLDISKYVTASQKAVSGKKFREAILILATLCPIARMDDLRAQVLGEQKHTPLYLHFMAQQINEKGRVIARRPSIIGDEQDSMEQAIKAEMHRHASLHHGIVAQGLILPAVNQINMEHHIRVNDLAEFVSNNQFVPSGHEYIYMRGLHYGLMGDFLLAAHLLLPQIENSVRYLLNQRGIITSKLDSQGIQDEFELGTLLYMSELEAIFGKDLQFELQGLLINRFGSNLRNLFAHGMMTANGFSSLQVVYFWWLVLYICCCPLLMQQSKDQASDSTEAQQS